MRKTAPLLVIMTLLCCGLGPPLAADPSMVGIWYSPFQPDEPNVMSLIEFRADGTFREEFRKCEKGDYVGYQTESGTWSQIGDVELIVAEEINGAPARAENTYKILMLTDTERRIQMDTQDYVFIGHRVQKFEFPHCAIGT